MKTAEGVLCFIEVKNVPHSKAEDIWVVFTQNGEAKEWKKVGQLQLPGGGIEANESHVECIQREVADELSLVLDDISFSEIGEDKFSMIGYETGKQILITVNLMYTCIGYEQFQEIATYTSIETTKILLMNLKDIYDGLDLRPGTLLHIQHFRRSRMQRATS